MILSSITQTYSYFLLFFDHPYNTIDFPVFSFLSQSCSYTHKLNKIFGTAALFHSPALKHTIKRKLDHRLGCGLVLLVLSSIHQSWNKKHILNLIFLCQMYEVLPLSRYTV